MNNSPPQKPPKSNATNFVPVEESIKHHANIDLKTNTSTPELISTNINPFQENSNPFEDGDEDEDEIQKHNWKSNTDALNSIDIPVEQSNNSRFIGNNLSEFSKPNTVLVNKTDDQRMLYHKLHFSDTWLFASIITHIILSIILLDIAKSALSTGSFTILVLIAVAVVLLLCIARYFVHKNRWGKRVR